MSSSRQDQTSYRFRPTWRPSAERDLGEQRWCVLRIRQSDRPRPAIGMTAEAADLAEIDQHVAPTVVLQQPRDAVGDVALGDGSRSPPCPAQG
ncbi:MAG: hypothetical protein U1E35_07695 [Rhodospirillales bacterium]